MSRWRPSSERFWSSVRGDKNGCWIWIGSRSDTGYGCFYAGRAYSAHRYMWEALHGPVPKGMCVLHRCDVRACVRPEHLWLGTKRENSQDMARKGRAVGPDVAGELHGGAKLTDADVRVIRASAATGIALATRFGVSPSLISLVRHRKAWTHI